MGELELELELEGGFIYHLAGTRVRSTPGRKITSGHVEESACSQRR